MFHNLKENLSQFVCFLTFIWNLQIFHVYKKKNNSIKNIKKRLNYLKLIIGENGHNIIHLIL